MKSKTPHNFVEDETLLNYKDNSQESITSGVKGFKRNQHPDSNTPQPKSNIMIQKDTTNSENFDDGLTRVAPKGKYKAGDKDYIRFREFWEWARTIHDEDGDIFLDWDKSVVGQFCFDQGFEEGKASEKERVLKMIDEINYSRYNWTVDGFIEELKQRIKEK